MPSFTIKSLLIGAGAASVFAAPAATSHHDTTNISRGIKSVHGNLTAMTEATEAWTGGLTQALPLVKAEANLESSIKEATLGAKASEKIDSDDTKHIIAYINSKIEPSIGKVLEALSEKKEQFTKADLTDKVAADVATLKQLTDILGDALLLKASADQLHEGTKALAKIDAYFASAIKTWAPAANSSASHMFRRDAVMIYANIKSVNSNMTELASTVDSWNGDLVAVIPITEAEKNLEQSIKEATLGVQASKKVDSANTKAIISSINNTLEPSIKKVLNSLSAKKAQFDKIKFTKPVALFVADLHELTDDLAATLVEKASADQKDAAHDAVAKINGLFSKATATFGTPDA